MQLLHVPVRRWPAVSTALFYSRTFQIQKEKKQTRENNKSTLSLGTNSLLLWIKMKICCPLYRQSHLFLQKQNASIGISFQVAIRLHSDCFIHDLDSCNTSTVLLKSWGVCRYARSAPYRPDCKIIDSKTWRSYITTFWAFFILKYYTNIHYTSIFIKDIFVCLKYISGMATNHEFLE